MNGFGIDDDGPECFEVSLNDESVMTKDGVVVVKGMTVYYELSRNSLQAYVVLGAYHSPGEGTQLLVGSDYLSFVYPGAVYSSEKVHCKMRIGELERSLKQDQKLLEYYREQVVE